MGHPPSFVLDDFFQKNLLRKTAAFGRLLCTYRLKFIQSISSGDDGCAQNLQQIRQLFQVLLLMILGQFFVELGVNHPKICFIGKYFRGAGLS